MTINTDCCQEHYDEVLRMAKASGQEQKLTAALKALEDAAYQSGVTECRLFRFDATPLSFIVHIKLANQGVLTGVLLWEPDEESGYDWKLHVQHEHT